MKSSVLSQHSYHESKSRYFWQGTVAMLPLSVAVLPWGVLAGSFAIDAGLSPFESQGLSAILFAGSAQLVAIGMIKTGAGLMTLLITTLFITSRHFLYSMSMRDKISPLPMRWRLLLGFLLTDELFAVCGQHNKQPFNRWYALGAGLSFYLVWNFATLFGIVVGSHMSELNELGLDFAVAATFIAIVVPNIKSLPIVMSVLVALLLSVGLTIANIDGGLLIASAGSMVAGYATEWLQGERS